MVRRLVKFLAFLVVLAGVALAVFAYVGDLAPAPHSESLTVTLNAD